MCNLPEHLPLDQKAFLDKRESCKPLATLTEDERWVHLPGKRDGVPTALLQSPPHRVIVKVKRDITCITLRRGNTY